MRVRVRDKIFTLDPAQVELRIDVRGTVDEAMRAGRSGGSIAELRSWFAGAFSTSDVRVVASLDSAALGTSITQWEGAAIDDPPFDGAVAVRDGAAAADPPRPGFRIDAIAAERLILEDFGREPREGVEGRSEAAPSAPASAQDHRGRSVVDLPLKQVAPRLEAAAVDAAVERARRLTAGPVVLTPEGEEISVTFPAARLTAALRSRVSDAATPTLEVFFDPKSIDEQLDELRGTLVRPPVSARFEILKDDKVSIVPGRSGTLVDPKAVADAVLKAASSDGRTGALPLERGAPPEFSTEDATALKIAGLVSKFSTNHACCQPRVKNIHRIADLVDGTVVRPGETVSLNAVVGERTVKNGFVSAPSIGDGEMVDTIGGGVSQFATTIFNALFHGGYDILERQPHSYYFKRYPMGHEATLSWPKPDIVFRNDTEAGLLIKVEYSETRITVKLYGDNGGRKVRAEVSNRQDFVKPPIELLPNPKLSPDDEKVKEGGALGWSLYVGRVMTFPDGTKKEERRKVTYKPRPRRVEVHPCHIPAGEEGYTGEPCPKPPEEDADAGVATIEPAPE
jgi:vancomycin resistance protein YoaR